MNESLVKPFEETVLLSDLEDVSKDWAELSLDQITELVFGDAAQNYLEFPVIKSIAAFGKAAWSIKKAFVLRNQLIFIQSLRRGNPDPKMIEKRRKALSSGEAWVTKEMETSLLYIERYTDSRKVKVQALFYRDLIDGRIDFQQYEEFIFMLDQLMISDIDYLYRVYKLVVSSNKGDFSRKDAKESDGFVFNSSRLRRLEYFGLLRGVITPYAGEAAIDLFKITDDGLYFYTIIHESKCGTRLSIERC